jgi:23S rRNA (uracil1939-C5)-methyltransferase
LARVEGQVLLTPFVIPGEVARVETTPAGRGMLRGRLLELVRPAPARAEPNCPYFFRCGGCAYQHATYDYQLEQKVAILRESLRRVGKIEAPDQIEVISGPPWQYRNRSQFHLAHGRIGYLEAASHRLVAIDHCPISSPGINGALAALIDMMRSSRFPRFLRSIEMFTNESQVQVNVRETEHPLARWFFEWCEERIPGATSGALNYPAAGFSFRVGHRSFFQVNRFLIDRLVETAIEDAAGDTAVDLYAGVGLFARALKSRFREVHAVEAGAGPWRDLEFNTGGSGILTHRVSTESYLESVTGTPDFVVADPPRAGLGSRVVAGLIERKPPRLVIVACDPATLARDLGVLLSEAYQLERLTLVDLFPQTYHFETVAALRKR